MCIRDRGSGEGTRILTPNYTMYSVEEDIKFVGLTDSNYLYVPTDKTGWYDRVILKRLLSTIPAYQLMIVDGPKGGRNRTGLLKNLDLFDLTIPWLFDEVNRPVDLETATNFSVLTNKHMMVFNSVDKQFAILL